MGVNAATFSSGGQQSQHYLPGGYSRLDFIKGTGGLVSASNVVIFGDCRGGKPNTIHWFGSPTEAVDTLRSGALLDAVRHAFAVGGNLVPQKIGAWRVNPGTQATRQLKASSNPVIDVTAWDYGLHTNQLKAKLEDGTSSGKKWTVKFQNNADEVHDNIEKESFSIQYVGSGSAVTMDITLTKLTTTVDASGDLDIAFASFPTIEDLVNYINDQTDYTAAVITGTPFDKTTELDTVTSQDIKSSAYTVHSDLQALIDVMNSSPWIDTAIFHSGAASRIVPDNDVDWVYFSGAIDGDYTSSEWTTSLGLAEMEDIQFIGASTADSGVHNAIKTHCASMNSVTGKAERQFILGTATGETIEQAITRAKNLASEYGMLAYPGFKHYDYDNPSVIKTWAGVYYAAKLLGAQAALAINEPHTAKTVDVLDWEKTLTPTEAETLIKNGVCPGIKTKDGRFVTGRTITTYQGADLARNEFSMMREALFVSRDLRTEIERSFVGKAMSNTLLSKVDAIVYGKLSAYNDLGLFNGTPPYWGYKKTIIGDVIKIDYDCYLTPPANFMFLTSHMHVFASTSA